MRNLGLDQRTVHEVAQQIHRRIFRFFGSTKFTSRYLIMFDVVLTDEVPEENRLNLILSLIRQATSARTIELALVWMDNAGYGHLELAHIFNQLSQDSFTSEKLKLSRARWLKYWQKATR
jgi:hypothetical protein